ncbi:coenzyme Q-binding protein COQ10 homolog B, mitochondrial [Thrips palmi]|uniref:Coenzyme Q-binding protein COQ10 homolog B, mitochondrial n=1 Tax=Thrips palmi TaxID=161013 RepID=A0A6P8Z0C0_THRPL|nr:coenzyme Q-binding protein COQ10 homolog B, mitochondrial [Thrips palmi]
MTLIRQCCCSSARILRLATITKRSVIPLRLLANYVQTLNSQSTHIHNQGFSTCSVCNSFFNRSSFSDKTKEYRGRKLVGFSMDQMYNVVSDVENYKNFVPFCKRSDVTVRKSGFLKGELSIGFPPITESYVSAVTLIRPRLVKAECTEGHLFDHLTTVWKFSPGLSTEPQSCVIDFHVSFSFRSAFHSQLAHVFFNELVRQMERAFFTEAEQRFGKPSIHTLKLEVKKNGDSQ